MVSFLVMEPSPVDLDAYFSRIGYTGPRDPQLATLRALLLAHVCAIPFENLNPWQHQSVSVDLTDVQQKLIHSGRGGYCYEHNTLLAAVLVQLGFDVAKRLARVRWQVPDHVITGRSHLCLRVLIDGRPWLADAGFGGIGITGPLAMNTAEVQTTPHESRRLVAQPDGSLLHQVQLAPDRWADVYRIEPHATFPVDVAMANWFTSTHPQSLFRRSLIVTRVQPDHRRNLIDRDYTRRFLGGRTETRTLTTITELIDVLTMDFNLPANDPLVTAIPLPSPA